jgi:NADH dehydrogenase [ubiquinone] 1 alpha subcomplex assembly factor 5
MPDQNSHVIFDRRLSRARRERAVLQLATTEDPTDYVAENLVERLQDIRQPLARILLIGASSKLLIDRLRERWPDLILADLALGNLGNHPQAVQCDEEFLPFATASFDAVISYLTLQQVNDVPGALSQIRQLLRPNGVFLAALIGGETLSELRHCLYQAEQETMQSVSPRVAPMLTAETATSLLQRAQFAWPVVDHERLTLVYPDAFALMRDLRRNGCGNNLQQRRRSIPARRLFPHLAKLYADRFPATQSGIFASFDIIYLHGWGDDVATTHG